MGKSSKPIIGYHYRPAYHHGLTTGPIDAFLEMRAGDRTAWRGELTASDIISINAPYLFGGEKDQGGLEGELDVMFGEATQPVNGYLVSVFGDQVPAWRGFTTVVWKGGRYGAMNPYPKPASYKIRRILEGWDGECWYPEKATIGGDDNTFTLQYPDFVTGFDTNAPTKFQLIGGAIANTTVDALNTDYWRAPLPPITVTGFECDFELLTEDPGDTIGIALETDTGAYWVGMMMRSEAIYDAAQRPHVNYWQAPDTDAIHTEALEVGVQYTFEAQLNLGLGTYTYWLRGPGGTLISTGTPDLVGTGTPAYLTFGRTGNTFTSSIGKFTRVAVHGYTSAGFINPAHVLYDARTNSDMGRESTANINEASLQAAADKLHAEAFGICPSWNPASESVEDFEQRICRLIGGSFSRSLEDGQWYLDLARPDYVLEDLPILTDDDILDFKEQPSTLDSAINSASVRYFDPERKEAIVTPPVRALGLVASFGTIHQTYECPEIPTASLATRKAQMMLMAAATPTRVFDLVTTRKTYAWRPNQYFRLQSIKRGIADMVCLVGEKQSGTLKSGAIRMKATQDIYSLPSTSFVEVEPGVDTTPSQVPTAITLQRAIEAPYVEMVAAMSRADLEVLPDDAGFAMAMAATETTDLDYTMMVQPDGGEYAEVARGEWTATATVVEAAARGDEDFTLDDGLLLNQVTIGMAALWDDEIVRVDAIDAGAGTIKLGRGCGDTVPGTHASGSRIWFYDAGFAADLTEYADGETINVKLLSKTGSQQLPLGVAVAMPVTFDQRQARPYPPAKLRLTDLTLVDAIYPTDLVGSLTVEWAHRDRLLQADQLVDTEEASVGPEAGTTYTVTFEQPPGSVVHTEAGISGTASTPYTLPSDGQVRVAVTSVRDGLDSWQALDHTFEYLNAPNTTRIVTGGDFRITTDGDDRIAKG